VKILCVLFSVEVYMVFFVCVQNEPNIPVFYTSVSFVSGSTLYMKIYFDPYKKKQIFFPPLSA